MSSSSFSMDDIDENDFDERKEDDRVNPLCRPKEVD
jgi:hypothetical protein